MNFEDTVVLYCSNCKMRTTMVGKCVHILVVVSPYKSLQLLLITQNLWYDDNACITI